MWQKCHRAGPHRANAPPHILCLQPLTLLYNQRLTGMALILRLFAATWLLVLGPGTPAAAEDHESLLGKAIEAYEHRRFDEAYRYAVQAAYKPSPRSDTFALLGELQYLRQDLAAAKTSWERALALEPSRTDVRQRLEQLGKELPVEQDLARSDTYPFVIRLADEQTAVDLTALRGLLRDVYRLVGQHFDTFPNYPIAVIAYAQQDFSRTQAVTHQIRGLYDGKIRVPLPSGPHATDDLKRVLWHEYAHVLIHDLSRSRCPIWLNEGLATVEEARVHPFPVEKFREALVETGGRPRSSADDPASGVVSWDDLWREREYRHHLLDVRYGQAYLVAQYLVRVGGWPQVVRLLKRLGQGATVPEALRAEYHQDPKGLEEAWWAWGPP